MSSVPTKSLKCSRCGRAIEVCACCDERDCPPPICYICMSQDLTKSRRRLYVHSGASFISELAM